MAALAQGLVAAAVVLLVRALRVAVALLAVTLWPRVRLLLVAALCLLAAALLLVRLLALPQAEAVAPVVEVEVAQRTRLSSAAMAGASP
ncbi:MAG TPA: hypothetical protein VFV87_15385 [Pirellulaceae bacterium]|nr:hypothetical protein [Pirellulaceae bacterium]